MCQPFRYLQLSVLIFLSVIFSVSLSVVCTYLLLQGNALIDENDFLFWVKKIQELRPEEPVDDSETVKNLMAAFKVFDLDNDGYITRDELKKAMDTIGETVTEGQLDEFMKMADTDKDGRINYEG